MRKYYLNGVEFNPTSKELRILERNIFGYFSLNYKEDLICNKFYHYEFKGYKQPLLCHVSNNMVMVHSPYNYYGSYKYNGEDTITLHSTYGRFDTYRKLTILGLPFMVCSSLSDEDAILSAETDEDFINELIEAL